MSAFINAIGTANPAHDIHEAFLAFATSNLPEGKSRVVFERMAARSGIAHRFSHMRPGDLAAGEVDADRFYARGAFPSTAARMAQYEVHARDLALAAVARLVFDAAAITHLIVASCTGFTAPGLDLHLAHALGLRADVSRTMISFMGCAAAIPALRAADSFVRANTDAQVLVVNVELCSLHLRETDDVETALSLMLFGDGAAAALVSSVPEGIEIGRFYSLILPNSADLITWHIGDQGFVMHLSGKVPGRIAGALRADATKFENEVALCDLPLWAVHGGGRTVLDAVELGFGLPDAALRFARATLHDHGNMSSATIMFTLARILASDETGDGMAMAFGPGLVAESFGFKRL
jgi:predicted naringenin-chalcone synthase